MITQSSLKEILNYDSRTGTFTWLVSRPNGVKVGDIAGRVGNRGYRKIGIARKTYEAHRLAFLYVNGEWPANIVDHIDGCKDNNAWNNLRNATNAQNQANSRLRAGNRLGMKGVCRYYNKFKAQIKADGKTVYLGLFDSPESAHAAYEDAAKKLFGEFARAA